MPRKKRSTTFSEESAMHGGGRRFRERRTLIAQEAARLIHESALHDYGAAKRKAAMKLGFGVESGLPDNSEIEQALREHLSLFAGDTHTQRLRSLREAAIEAMGFLARFQPRLVGAVLDGTADEHSPVCLHLFSDEPDAVAHFLGESGIPIDRSERRLRLDPRREIIAPVYAFIAGETPFELTVLPLDSLRQAPLDRSGERPVARASLGRLHEMLAGESG